MLRTCGSTLDDCESFISLTKYNSLSVSLSKQFESNSNFKLKSELKRRLKQEQKDKEKKEKEAARAATQPADAKPASGGAAPSPLDDENIDANVLN